ncbi:hypothetical protein [Halomontanus rarus]|uniref:hypothetical protein n=1 Tax=Halomontanus rarus TaxID=3034020 RepID=UPI0023E7ED42|nr:hypothetical protein [Halovivax sp. TS33]
MTRLACTPLNYSGNNDRNSTEQPTNKPQVRQTADGLEADFPARADYDLEILTVEQAARETIVADGGSVEINVYLCGGCDRVYRDKDAVDRHTIAATGEEIEYDEPQCPHCGTNVSYNDTLETTAAFEVTDR